MGFTGVNDDAGLADSLALAAERLGVIVRSARDVVEALEADPGSADDPDHRAGARAIESLAESGRQLRGEAEELSRRLTAVRRQVEGVARDTRRSGAAPPSPPAPSADRPRALTRPGRRFERPSEGMRQIVVRMAASGQTRVEIEERIRQDFGIAHARAVVDHVLDGSTGVIGDAA